MRRCVLFVYYSNKYKKVFLSLNNQNFRKRVWVLRKLWEPHDFQMFSWYEYLKKQLGFFLSWSDTSKRNFHILFFTECSSGLFGTDCNNTCGNCVNGSICNPQNGACTQGCHENWSGPMCNSNNYKSYFILT